MWAVQRVFGDDWRTVATFRSKTAAEIVAAAWHQFGEHQGYRAVEVEDAPADALLGSVAVPPLVRMAAQVQAMYATQAATLPLLWELAEKAGTGLDREGRAMYDAAQEIEDWIQGE